MKNHARQWDRTVATLGRTRPLTGSLDPTPSHRGHLRPPVLAPKWDGARDFGSNSYLIGRNRMVFVLTSNIPRWNDRASSREPAMENPGERPDHLSDIQGRCRCQSPVVVAAEADARTLSLPFGGQDGPCRSAGRRWAKRPHPTGNSRPRFVPLSRARTWGGDRPVRINSERRTQPRSAVAIPVRASRSGAPSRHDSPEEVPRCGPIRDLVSR
jgi:hypothetical protein